METTKIEAEVVVVCDVYEHELGWGSKHDGFVIANKKSDLDELVSLFKEKASHEYFLTIGDTLKTIELSEKGKGRVKAHKGNYLFIDKIEEVGTLMN
ncbi:hypothetical protein PQC39_gp080 [Vibrio phage Vp_R1]|uniref:Uncharacterized protein n=1 Tax=Vibrio phage Vp_R1 TaxID=2059867 RepID=A0A2H5BQ35_9CAUD|nr:hypothetical protein PQC39_gp080 [Vibrio phage Vp_R1]AUG88444.1 hypothetical protein VPR_080 [Vibrio phage Vp_R1]